MSHQYQSKKKLPKNSPQSQQPQPQLPQFTQHSYKIVICLLFSFVSLVNGMCWVVVSPISKPIQQAYDQSSAMVALIPMSYMICYIFINFPSNWVLDVKGIKKGIITGSVFTAIGTGIRCFVNYSFEYVIIGQFLCAIGQPFILNAPTKIATRWFLPKNRSLALALLAVVNIVGTAIGFIVPTIFVDTQNPMISPQKLSSTVRDQFWMLLLAQFCLALVCTLLNIFFFTQRPPKLPSLSAMVQHTDFSQSIKILLTCKKFLLLGFAFATVNGAFNIYGSLLQQLLDPYGITSDDTSILAASMMIIGILSAALIGIYVEKTLNYKKVFIILSILGMLQTVSFTILLKIGADFIYFLIAVIFQGILFIPLIPLSFDFGCDVLFPIGQAQITGTLMTFGQIFGIMFILICQQVFGLGDKQTDQKQAAFNTSVYIGSFTFIGCILLWFFNFQLKRSKLENPSFKKQYQNKSSDNNSTIISRSSDNNQSLISGKQKY